MSNTGRNLWSSSLAMKSELQDLVPMSYTASHSLHQHNIISTKLHISSCCRRRSTWCHVGRAPPRNMVSLLVAVPGAYVELTPLATCPGVCCPVAGMERPSVPIIVADLSLLVDGGRQQDVPTECSVRATDQRD